MDITLHICLQCFIVSTVNALQTPMINASMVGFLFLHLVSTRVTLYFIFSYVFKDRFYVTGTMEELTTRLVELVGLPSLWQKGLLIKAVKYNTRLM